MKLFAYTVGGIANDTQSDAGKLRVGYYCQCYSDEQALGWARQRGVDRFLNDLRVISKKEV